VLFLGEVAGRSGIAAITTGLKDLRSELGADYVICCAEGATGGFGVGKQHAVQISKSGVDVLTGGEKLYFKPDLVEFLPKCSFVLRPANLPPSAPGRGYRIQTVNGVRIATLSLIGTTGPWKMAASSPMQCADYLIPKLKEQTDNIIVSFHSSTTAESATLAHYLKGRVSAVVGVHSKVLTADAVVLPGGTAFISDAGRCGAFMSAGGFVPEPEIEKLMTGLPIRSHESWDDTELEGALIAIGDDGKATSIEPIRKKVTVKRPEATK